MPRPKNAMEIFLRLEKSNCGECGRKTCLAFAGAVYKGEKDIGECPRVDAETRALFAGDSTERNDVAENQRRNLKTLQAEIAAVDLSAAAARTGGRYKNGTLTLRVLGKNFSVDGAGNLAADIHINPWVAAPFLDYVLHGKGLEPTGEWVPFRELKDGAEGNPLFHKRCEQSLKRVADVYTDLFDDMVHIFGGRQVAEQFQADISVVLLPLPKVPIMVCYWRPEDGLGSSLYLFFDRTAERNLNIGSVFSLGAGIAQMFEKLSVRHGFPETASSEKQ